MFHHPSNIFVAGFIGMPQMNFFDARLTRTGDRYAVELGGAQIELSPEKAARLLAREVQSQEVTLGVRPEHIALTESENAVFAAVDVSEMMGSAVHIHVDACERDVVIVVPVSEEEAKEADERFRRGAPVRFTFRGSAAHLFDKETGMNLEQQGVADPFE